MDRSLDPAVVDPAPWETSWDPDELTGVLEGRLLQPEDEDADRPAVETRLAPAPGVTVTAGIPRPGGHPPIAPGPSAVTQPDGRFRIEGVPYGCYTLTAKVPGHARATGGFGIDFPGRMLTPPKRDFPLGLRFARPLVVAVREPSGAPVAGATVRGSGFAWSDSATTDAQGIARLDAVRSPFMVETWTPGHDVVQATVDPSRFPAGEEMRVSLVAPPAPPLSGRIVRAADGAPVAGAVVTWSEDPTQRTRTGADGVFTLDVPRAGRVSAFADGLAWTDAPTTVVAPMEFRLRDAESVSGRVLGHDGKPAAGARLLAVTTSHDGRRIAVPGPLSAADGSFRFSWLPRAPRGDERGVVVLAFHRRLGASAPVAPGTSADLRLSGAREISGRFTDHAGRPVSGSPVWASWTFEGLSDADSAAADVLTRRGTLTGADGSFTLRCVPAGLPLEVRGDRAGTVVLGRVAVGESAPVNLALPKGGTVTAVVRDAAGAPVPGAIVDIELTGRPDVEIRRAGETGADGRVAFEDLPDAEYEIRASAAGYGIDAVGSVRTGGETALVVRRFGRIRVRAELPQGVEHPADLTAWFDDLVATDLPSRPNLCAVAGAGIATADSGSVTPGRWRVRVVGGTLRGTVPEVEVGDGEERTVTVRLESRSVLRGTVLTSRGAPVADETIHLLPPRDGGPAAEPLFAKTGADGRFEAAGLSAGTWGVRILPRGKAPFEAEVAVTSAGTVEEREFRLPAAGSLRVVVKTKDAGFDTTVISLADASGAPLPAWTMRSGAMVHRTRPEADGSAEFHGVRAGTVRVTVAITGRRAPLASEADVRDGEVATVTFE